MDSFLLFLCTDIFFFPTAITTSGSAEITSGYPYVLNKRQIPLHRLCQTICLLTFFPIIQLLKATIWTIC